MKSIKNEFKVFDTEAEWLDFRKGKITGTMASAILGKNPYLTNTEAWQLLTGKAEYKDIGDKPYVVRGKLAEEHIMKLFMIYNTQYQLEFKPKKNQRIMYYDSENQFIASTPDFVVRDTENNNRLGIVEVKTAEIIKTYKKEEWKDNKIPNNYYIQVLQEMYTTNAEFGILLVELIYGSDYIVRKALYVDRNDVQDDIDYLINEEKNFYQEHVKTNKRPPLLIMQ